MSDRDTMERAIRHIDSCLDVDPWARDIAIEAMKAQLSEEGTTKGTTSDCIRRQDAIDAMDTLDKFGCDPDGKLVWYDDDKHYVPYVHYEDMVYAVKNLPSVQPEQRWIPCAERLPERGVSVLISHVGFVSEDYLDTDDGALFFWNSGLDLDEERQNIAWMPLPSAWKGDNNA